MAIVVEENGARTPFSRRRLQLLLRRFLTLLRLPPVALSRTIDSIEASLPEEVEIHDLLGLAAEALAQKVTEDPAFSDLAGRVEAYRIRRRIPWLFSQNFQYLRDYVHPKLKTAHPLVSKEANEFVQKHASLLDAMIVPERDDLLSFFGIKTLANSYLLSRNNIIAETPQYLFMRVAVGIHGLCLQGGSKLSIERVHETYEAMSTKHFVHSSPTLFNAATENSFLSLCFLLAMEEDSINGIYKTLHKAALILKGSGGIGIHMHDVRSNGSLIKSSNGTSNGLVPMLRVFNNTARYVDQGGNKRPGAIAVYLEPWHGDIQEVLDLRKNHGQEELRARDLFYALWIPDLFMERVEKDENWSLFSPSEAPGLSDVYGKEFNELFLKYEAEGLASRTLPARKLWLQIMDTQIETGMPFMLYKDTCNRKLNQKNLGTIKSSNLCCEIVEYSSPDETAVCNLGLLALPSFVESSENTATYDFPKLHKYTKVLAKNLDRVIDVSLYPTEEARRSNFKHRPIAIGVQGLADVFMMFRIPFESAEAESLNRQIFETIYHGAVEASIEMAIENGSYESFPGSPASQGQLQFDFWNCKPEFFDDWDDLKQRVVEHGLRNSLLVAPMPTASTSQILGYNECFEPYTSNVYLRRVLSGEYQVVNRYLIEDLKELGIWNSAMKQQIVMDNGLVQGIDIIPQELKLLYKTVWEVSQKKIVNMAADRGCFVDQLQSMNIFMKTPSIGALNSCHFYAWKKGLKTGMYYLRSQAALRAIQFTIDKESTAAKLSSMEMPDLLQLTRKRYVPQTKYATGEVEEVKDGTRKRFKVQTRAQTRTQTRTQTREALNTSKPKATLAHNKTIDTHTRKVRKTGPKPTPNSHLSRRIAEDHSHHLHPQLPSEFDKPSNITHDIFDTTPRYCEIKYSGSCDSCSG